MDKIHKQKIEELEATIKRAQEQIEEIKQEASKSQIKYPNINDILWCVLTTGEIVRYKWDNSELDRKRFNQGHLFYSYEDAVFEVEYRKVIVELKLFAQPISTYWDKGKKHYYIEYSYHFNSIETDYTLNYQHNDIYFESEEDALNAIAFVGEDRVKKYYLGVEE